MLPSDCILDRATCCAELSSIAEHILGKVYPALLECYPAGPDPLVAYTTMGVGDDGVMDSLTVAFVTASVSAGARSSSGMLVQLPVVRGVFEVRLRETGWPTGSATDTTFTPPDPTSQANAAFHAFAHGEKMYRTLLNMAATRTMFPPDAPRLQGGAVDVGPLTPINPSGGTIGWYARVTVDLPWGGG